MLYLFYDTVSPAVNKPAAATAILLLTLYVYFEVKFRGFFPYSVLKVKLLHPPAGFYALRAIIPPAVFTSRLSSGKCGWHTRLN
jgi:hypothetical protein